jgi:hypothetical protein
VWHVKEPLLLKAVSIGLNLQPRHQKWWQPQIAETLLKWLKTIKQQTHIYHKSLVRCWPVSYNHSITCLLGYIYLLYYTNIYSVTSELGNIYSFGYTYGWLNISIRLHVCLFTYIYLVTHVPGYIYLFGYNCVCLHIFIQLHMCLVTYIHSLTHVAGYVYILGYTYA